MHQLFASIFYLSLACILYVLSGSQNSPENTLMPEYIYSTDINKIHQTATNKAKAIKNSKNSSNSEIVFEVVDIGKNAGLGSYAFGINDRTEIVGRFVSEDDYFWHAFIWLPEDNYGLYSGFNDLGVIEPSWLTELSDINNNGQAVGYVRYLDMSTASVTWINNTWKILQMPNTVDESLSYGINNFGEIVGRIHDYLDDRWHPFLQNEDGETYYIPMFPGFSNSLAQNINDRGIVVGYAWNGFGNSQAWHWRQGLVVGLDCPDDFDFQSVATTVNEANQASGYCAENIINNEDGTALATLWHGPLHQPLSQDTVLPSPGDRTNNVLDINNSAVMVGFSLFFGGNYEAQMWLDNEVVSLFNVAEPSVFSSFEIAMGINEHNHVIGYGIVQVSFNLYTYHAFLLLPK